MSLVEPIEYAKGYILNQINEHGFEDNQIEIDFADICTIRDIWLAAKELGYTITPGQGQGVWWVHTGEYEELDIFDVIDVNGEVFAILVDVENEAAYVAKGDFDIGRWEIPGLNCDEDSISFAKALYKRFLGEGR